MCAVDPVEEKSELAAARVVDEAFENVPGDGTDPYSGDAHGQSDPEPTLRVLVYSDDHTVRQQVMASLGRRPAADLPALEFVEVATAPMVISLVDRGGLDLIILDGEAAPAGGMGIARQLKDEIYHCPPTLVLVGRPQDAWLATWSRADGVVAHPIDAMAMAKTTTSLLRSRHAVATR